MAKPPDPQPLLAFRAAAFLRAAAVLLAAPPAAAHFLWSRIELGPKPQLEVTFGEAPDEPTSAVPLERLQSARAWDGARHPLSLAPAGTVLTATFPAEAKAAGASQCWGVVDREGDGTGAFLLEYYAKAATLDGEMESVDLPLEIFARRDADHLVACVRRGEAAVGGVIVYVHTPSGRTLELRADDRGEVRIDDVHAGAYGIRARWLEDRSGDLDGKRYGEVRHYSTLTFQVLEPAKVDQVNGPNPAADPRAYALLNDAHDSRQVMPADFPGFRCDLVLHDGDQTWKGTLVYRRHEDPAILFENLDGDEVAWVRRQILNAIGHRRGGDFAQGDGRHPLALAPEDGNAYGRLIRVNDATDSSYRVRDHKVLEVTRTMEGSRFTISVIDTMEADAGRYLANHFVVAYRDPASGALQKMEGYRDSYARVKGVWLPSSRTVLTLGAQTSPSVRSIRLLKHQTLSAPEPASR